MIPTKPPPSFRDPDIWSPEFIDFVSLCLVKNPEERATATDLLTHEFIRNAKPCSILSQMIAEAKEIRENQSYRHAAAISQANKQLQNNNNNNNSHDAESDDEDVNSRTMKQFDCGTLVPGRDDGDGTMIAHTDCGTLVPDSATMVELQSNLGTMVINSDSEESTMKRHDTNPDKPKYRPLFLDHFDRKEAEAASFVTKSTSQHSFNDDESSSPEDPHQDASPQRPQPQVQTPSKQQQQMPQPQQQQQQQQIPSPSAPPLTQSLEEQQLNEERQRFQSHLQLQLNQISAANGPTNQMHQQQQQQQQIQYQQSPVAVTTPDGIGGGGNGAMEAHNRNFNNRINLIDSEYDSLKFLNYEQLEQRLASIDKEMEKELAETNKRYYAKRKPIIDAIEAKQQKRQQKLEEF